MLRKSWTEEEDQILRDIWLSKEPLNSFMDLLPGRRSETAYARGRSIGLPDRAWIIRKPAKPPLDNFMKYVEKSDGCWIWKGRKDKDGYGLFDLHGHSVRAHRASHLLNIGDPGDLHVLHTCDNPSCVNPNHLYAGTRSQNMQDMVNRKRRNINGEKNGNAKLSNRDAVELRNLYATGDFTQRELALKFAVSPATVSNIVTKKKYQEAA